MDGTMQTEYASLSGKIHTLVIDKTLSISGAAADAKATGDAMERLEDISEEAKENYEEAKAAYEEVVEQMDDIARDVAEEVAKEEVGKLTAGDVDAYTKEETDEKIEAVAEEAAPKVGDILTTVRTDLGDDWLLCNGDVVDSATYPELDALLHLNPADASCYFGIGQDRDYLRTAVYADGYYYYCDGWQGKIFRSEDLETWTEYATLSGFSGSYADFGYLNGKFVYLTLSSPGNSGNLKAFEYTDLFGSPTVYTLKDSISTNDVKITFCNGYYYYADGNRLYKATSLNGPWSDVLYVGEFGTYPKKLAARGGFVYGIGQKPGFYGSFLFVYNTKTEQGRMKQSGQTSVIGNITYFEETGEIVCIHQSGQGYSNFFGYYDTASNEFVQFNTTIGGYDVACVSGGLYIAYVAPSSFRVFDRTANALVGDSVTLSNFYLQNELWLSEYIKEKYPDAVLNDRTARGGFMVRPSKTVPTLDVLGAYAYIKGR